jgi:protein TonB
MSNTKTIVLILAAFVLFGIALVGGGAALWYFKYYRSVSAADAGPMAGQALELPADTAVVAGFDVRAFFASAGYKQMATGEIPGLAQSLSPEQAEPMKKQVREGIEKGLNEADQKIGIRLDRDLDRLLIAASSVGSQTPELALMAIGRFDRAKVTRALAASAKAEGASVTSKTVEGVDVQVFAAPGKPGAELAFFDDATLLVGSAGAVGAVLANHAKRIRPLESNSGLLGLVKGLDPSSGYWFVVDQPVIARAQKEAGGTPVPLPRTLTLAGKFDGGLELTGEMADEAAAKGVVQMVEQGLGMARAQVEQNPEVQKLPGAKQVLDGIQVKAEGQRVRISVSSRAGGSTGLAGVIAAAAIPSLLRARTSANESATIGDIRTVISAEMAFASASGGWYGDLACLSEPKGCINGYTGPNFLDAALASATEKSGYRRAFQSGPTAAAPRGFDSFAYTAMPASPGQTGVRSFCGDSRGVVCSDPNGAEIVPQAGACPGTCAPLDGSAPPPALPPRASIDSAPVPPRAQPAAPVRTPRPARVTEAAPQPTARPAPETPIPTQPVHVGGQIREPRKLKNVSPAYPPIAKQARVQGLVILECTIGPQGRVTDVRVLRGIPLLDAAAVDAVRQWEYEPTLVDGVPVSVVMTVTVNFKLS